MTKPNSSACVTIVMTIRERHSLTIQSLLSILSNTPPVFHLIFVDCQSPLWVREQLDILVKQYGIEVVRSEEPFWPTLARIKVLDRLSSEYTVFIDNDIQVEAGWLERLIECANETGAGIVGPLYLWGNGRSVPTIHMAGGKLTIYPGANCDGFIMEEEHQLINQRPDDVQNHLYRRPCDFVEYHCMLVRTQLLQEHKLIDENIVCVHEHIHAALTASRLGYSIYMEPASRVNYLAFADFMLEDLSLFRLRWSPESGNQSIQHFAQKWGVCDDSNSFGGVRTFLSNHVGHVDPLRVSTPVRRDQNVAIRKEELQQTRSGLLDLAIEQGYETDELNLLSNAYFIAQALTDGGYRSCGRPFINHLSGTASVLLLYHFRIEVVAAALLHAAYSHCPAHPDSDQAAIDEVCRKLGGENHRVERLVRAYTFRGMRSPGSQPAIMDAGRLSVFVAEVEMIALANEIDMTLSGEIHYSAPRNDEMTPAQLDVATEICKIIGVTGMSHTLQQERANKRLPPPPNLLTRNNMSYRFNIEHTVMMPMPSNARFLLQPTQNS